MRPMDPAVKALLAQPHYEFLIVRIAGVSDWCLTNAPVHVEHGGYSYQANGLLLEADPLAEQADLKSGETQFEFADNDRTFTNALLAEGFLFRPIYAQFALFDLEGEFVGTLPYFSGHINDMKRPSIDDENQAPLILSAQWLWSIGENPAGRNCSEGSQKGFFPSDQGMNFINDLGKELPWGRE